MINHLLDNLESSQNLQPNDMNTSHQLARMAKPDLRCQPRRRTALWKLRCRGFRRMRKSSVLWHASISAPVSRGAFTSAKQWEPQNTAGFSIASAILEPLRRGSHTSSGRCLRVSSIRPNSTNYYIGFYNALEEGYNDTKGNDWMAYERGQAAYKATIAQGQGTDVSQNVGTKPAVRDEGTRTSG